MNRHPENIEAWQLWLRGNALLYQNTERANEHAISYYQMALQKQPDFAQAYVGIALAYDNIIFFGFSPPARLRQRKYAALEKALELDPNNLLTYSS